MLFILSAVLAMTCHLCDGTLELLDRDNSANLFFTAHMDLNEKILSKAQKRSQTCKKNIKNKLFSPIKSHCWGRCPLHSRKWARCCAILMKIELKWLSRLFICWRFVSKITKFLRFYKILLPV